MSITSLFETIITKTAQNRAAQAEQEAQKLKQERGDEANQA